MATSSPKRVARGKPKQYTTCLLYSTEAASKKLTGLTYATCNHAWQKKIEVASDADVKTAVPVCTPAAPVILGPQDRPQFTVSDRMSCNYCDIVFSSRLEQKRHYRSDWHRYNLKQRLKGMESVSEESFESIAGNVSSISGSDSDTESESESTDKESRPRPKPTGIPIRLRTSGYSSTDSESDSEGPGDVAAHRLPKVYFRNGDGELVSLYRCVIHHKKQEPVKSADLFSMATDVPNHMTWAIFMAGGGHFAGAVFNKDKLVLHKTFHRYVVRAKRGTAQCQRDSQGNAPKSGGASLRRYNEAALTLEIQELIASWRDQINACDLIFLRAPSFNRRIFFSGKAPPFRKDDLRIRQIPLQTKRPTFNEVRRVYELLASIECYGDETQITDFIPVSPPQTFNRETGQLRVLDETELSPKHRKLWNKKIGNSTLTSNVGVAEASTQESQTSGSAVGVGAEFQSQMGGIAEAGNTNKEKLKSVADQIREEERVHSSSGTSTGSEAELVETMETINLAELKEFAATKKPKRRKKKVKKRRNSLKCQTEPESSVFDEEKYHLKNDLYTASKTGDLDTLRNLLAIFSQPTGNPGISHKEQRSNLSHDQQGNDGKPDSGSCDKEKTDGKLANDLNSDGCTSSHLNEDMESSKQNPCEEDSTGSLKEMCSIVEDGQGIQNTAFVTSEVDDFVCVSRDTQTKSQVRDNTGQAMDHTGQALDHSGQVIVDMFSEMGDFVCPILVGNNCDNSKIVMHEGEKVTDASPATPGMVSKGKATGEESCDRTAHLDVEQGNSGTVGVNVDQCVEGDAKLLKTDEHEAITDTNSQQYSKQGSSTCADSDVTMVKRLDIKQLTGAKISLPDLSPVVTATILNEAFGDNDTSLLHVASREGHKGAVTLLMEAGADPAVRDKGGLTPYMVAKDKPTRNEFRKFISQWPGRYDYVAAQIPSPLTEEQEAERKLKEAEKKKVQKKARQERQKVKRVEDEAREKEEKEKKRFLQLSDSEKRALAAEKRFLAQASRDGVAQPVLSRCFLCGVDMTGKVPFEYMVYKFCTSGCLQQHRRQNSTR